MTESPEQMPRRPWRRDDGRVHGWIKWGGVPTLVVGAVATYLAVASVKKAGAIIGLAEQAGRDHPAIVENTKGRHEQNVVNGKILTELENLNRNLEHLVDSDNHGTGRK